MCAAVTRVWLTWSFIVSRFHNTEHLAFRESLFVQEHSKRQDCVFYTRALPIRPHMKAAAARKLLELTGDALRSATNEGHNNSGNDHHRSRNDYDCGSSSSKSGRSIEDRESRPLPATFQLYPHEMQIDRWCASHQWENPGLVDKVRRHICGRPSALWLGDWGDAASQAHKESAKAAREDKLFCFVLYDVPDRDCGLYSKGGACNVSEYYDWVRGVARGCAESGGRGIFILEPDALAQAVSTGKDAAKARREILENAIRELRGACPKAYIYMDIGNPRWHSPAVILEELREMSVWDKADGVALNVSNSCTTNECYEYGREVTRELGSQVGFVIDTSRNGAGPPLATGEAQWANPPSLRIGSTGSTTYAREKGLSKRLHAVLWIKAPGESDGECNGAPPAGHIWPVGVERLLGNADA